ncbi:MAG: methionyl-tRNA formyltransferase [Vicinamibacterales bacterium]
MVAAPVTPLRLVYFGTPQFAVPTLERLIASPHAVVGVVTQPDRPSGRGHQTSPTPVKATALPHGIPVFQPATLKDPDIEPALRALAPDLGVVAAYGRIIPARLITLPRLGMINVHASLLPRYRGAAPIHRAVINGDAETGVTIMRVVPALDAGAMFATATRPIGEDETSDVVERDLAVLGADLLVRVVDQLAAGTAVEVEQDASRSTYAERLTKDEGRVDWTLPAPVLRNRIRGLYPWPHAYTFLDGARLILLHATPGPATAAPAGTVIQADAGGLLVAAGGGTSLLVDRLQPEGRRPMDARAFLAGRPVPVGAVLG